MTRTLFHLVRRSILSYPLFIHVCVRVCACVDEQDTRSTCINTRESPETSVCGFDIGFLFGSRRLSRNNNIAELP